MIAGVVHLAHLSHAGFVFAREGVLALIDTSRLPLPARAAVRLARLVERPASKVAANRLAAALTRLGPTYVKLGQFLATRPDVVGVAFARDLESLQDKMSPFPQAEADRQVEAALGQPLRTLFSVFGAPWVKWFTQISIWVAVGLTFVSGWLYLWRNRALYLDDM